MPCLAALVALVLAAVADAQTYRLPPPGARWTTTSARVDTAVSDVPKEPDGPIITYIEPDRSKAAEPCDTCWTFDMMPEGLIYSPYLAGEKESRFRSYWAHEKDSGWIWDITLGGRVGLLRYGTTGDARPQGWQLDIEGAGFPRLDSERGGNLISADFRFGIPLSYGNDYYQMKFAYYHLSSHLGDEFLIRNPGFPRLNFTRDVLVWGHSITPCDNLRLYVEAGWAFVSDVSEPWEFQFGIDWAPTGSTGLCGTPFFAANGHLREEVDFGGNVVVQVGWAWRTSPASGLFRVGFEYFGGKSDQFSFFNRTENKVGLALWYDY